MEIKSKSKSEKKIASRKKAQERIKALSDKESKVKSWLGIGGQYSRLEIVILAYAKFDIVYDATKHLNSHLIDAYNMTIKHERKIFTAKTKKELYSSRVWKILRYQAFEKYGNRCQCCGGAPSDHLTMHVDHIKPRSTHPDLELDINNLQILCEDCNVGKINQWDTDWRP